MANSLEIIPLFSSSSGNATLVKTPSGNILFDCGKSCKQISQALLKVGVAPDDISAIFITHSHSDHIAGVNVFVKKYNCPVYATEPTLNKIIMSAGRFELTSREIVIGEKACVSIGDDVMVCSYPTPHDAVGSVCYRVFDRKSNKSISIMTDLGYVTKGMVEFVKGTDAILLESNYDPEMLDMGPYPWTLKQRIKGNGGHISNAESAQFMEFLINNGTYNLILGHLSPHNNTETVAKTTVTQYLKDRGLHEGTDYILKIAKKEEPTEGYKI